MEFCGSCGTRRESHEQRFCRQCGTPLPAQSASQAPPSAPVITPTVAPAVAPAPAHGGPVAPPGTPSGQAAGRFGRVVALVAGSILAMLVLGALVWNLAVGGLPDAPEGLAPIPDTFADVQDPTNPVMRGFAGTAISPIEHPDREDGPGRVATYRYLAFFDATTPQGEVDVYVVSARSWASIHESVGEQVDSGVEGVTCWQYPNPTAYDCGLEYGNGWLLTADTTPGLTERGRSKDLKALAAILGSVKENNAFERAVQNHATM